MKKAVVLFFIILIFTKSDAQIKMLYDSEKSEKDKIEKYINSGYKAINIYRVDVDEVDWQSDTTLLTEIKINDDNSVITEINHSPYSKTIINYNGNVLSREIYNDNGQLSGKTLYSYNSSGSIDKRELFFGDIKAFDEIYDYENGNLIKMKYFAGDGTIISHSVFKYDDANNLIEEDKYNSNDEEDYKYEYKYDSKGKLLEERIILANGKKTVTNYSYDENGNIAEKITKDNDGKLMSYIKYQYKGKDLIEEYYDTPDLKIKKTYTYSNGLLSSVKYLEPAEANSYIWLYVYGN